MDAAPPDNPRVEEYGGTKQIAAAQASSATVTNERRLDTYLVFDFETSGFSATKDRIVQVGICGVVKGSVVRRDGWLVRQEITIPADATAVHGITTQDMMAKGIPPKESLGRLFAVMSEFVTCAGHNIHRFDNLFLLAEAHRFGLTPPETRDFVDTAALFRGWKLGIRKRPGETHQSYAERVLLRADWGVKYSLPTCIKQLHIEADLEHAHDARNDAYMTHLILARLQDVLSLDS